MKKFLYALCIAVISISLLTACSGTESFMSRAYDAEWDLDGDGDYGDRSGENNVSFKGRCNHVDNHIPWNECDKCGLHKVYW